MTVDECYRFLQLMSRKSQSASLTPKEFESTFNSAQRDRFNELLGKIIISPHIALGQNERIAERLIPFKTTDQELTVNTQLVTYPTGFQAITGMVNKLTGKAIQYISDAKLRGRLTSTIDPIGEADPAVFTNTKNGWKVWPSTITSVLVSYYKLPDPVVWAYTTDGNGRAVYNSGASKDPQWDDLSNEEILANCCYKLGISFSSPALVQYGQAAKVPA